MASAALELEVPGAPRDVIDMAADARAVWLLSEHGAVHYSQLMSADGALLQIRVSVVGAILISTSHFVVAAGLDRR